MEVDKRLDDDVDVKNLDVRYDGANPSLAEAKESRRSALTVFIFVSLAAD